MSKHHILWIVIGVLVIAGVIFAVTRKSASQTVTGTNTDNTLSTQTDTPATPEGGVEPTQVATISPTPAVAPASKDCTRNYDPKKFDGKQVDYKNKVATLSVKGFGSFTIALSDKEAPKTVENFVKLSQSGFYDCLTFHRVAKDFVVQGGDPEGSGKGGPGYTVPAEIKLLHTKGAVAMARTPDQINPKRESSGSQFYIALDALPMLDGAYTVFGQVTKGMDIVEKIGQVEISGVGDGPPKQPVVIEKVTITNK